jgi:hypothetical protein
MILSMPLEGGVTWMNGERAVDERQYRKSGRAVQVQNHVSIAASRGGAFRRQRNFFLICCLTLHSVLRRSVFATAAAIHPAFQRSHWLNVIAPAVQASH